MTIHVLVARSGKPSDKMDDALMDSAQRGAWFLYLRATLIMPLPFANRFAKARGTKWERP